MAHAPARVALLSSNRAGLRASRRFVARLAAVIAEPLLRRAILCNVSQIPALETPFPTKLIRHSDFCKMPRFFPLPTNPAFQPSSFVRIGPATSEMSGGDKSSRAMERPSGALLQGRLYY
ncbi:hypothetical protein BD311DRAFT_749040 [Dichomitus squalens]|uniref:Uncharacterized protein n=1 Tax=Dichomitus squalens TaxID=114155 RepID=A0A4Q9MY58_9APHY|nr:hypothetical protein BD311DRAFT_749040 [Dichomitus squalens]